LTCELEFCTRPVKIVRKCAILFQIEKTCYWSLQNDVS